MYHLLLYDDGTRVQEEEVQTKGTIGLVRSVFRSIFMRESKRNSQRNIDSSDLSVSVPPVFIDMVNQPYGLGSKRSPGCGAVPWY